MCEFSATKGAFGNKGNDEKVSLSTKDVFINKGFNGGNVTYIRYLELI